MKLHWQETRNVRGEWHSEEQLAGTPDFIIQKQGHGYFLKMRSARQWLGPFDTLADAKAYAESV